MATATPTLHSPYPDQLVNAMTNGSYWILDSSRTITWATTNILDAIPSDLPSAIGRALSRFEDVANIHFVYKGHYATFDLSNPPADIVIAVTDLPSPYLGLGFYPCQQFDSVYPNAAGDVILDWLPANFYSLADGSQGFLLLMHEIGHALGLKHPHDSGGTGYPTFPSLGLSTNTKVEFTTGDGWDVDIATIMSYNDDLYFDYWPGDPAALMPLDVIALQALYGPNMSTNAGDSVHQLFALGKYQTIWDASGTDWISAANSTYGWVIFLEFPTSNPYLAPHLSHIAGAFPIGDQTSATWVFNAEHVQGSAQRDFILGNSQPNALLGRGGDDIIAGLGSNDTIWGRVVTTFFSGLMVTIPSSAVRATIRSMAVPDRMQLAIEECFASSW